MSLELVSFNVRGLRDRKKRRTIFRHLHVRYPKHAVILQETHSSVDIESQWKTEWGGNVLFAHGEKTSRGVCFLIPKDFEGEVTWLRSEHAGRTLTVNINIQNIAMYVVGVYAPTQSNEKEQLSYFRELRESLNDLDISRPFIVCGDMNVHMTVADTSNIRYRDTQSCSTVKELMLELGLTDVWRSLNPDKKMFTWRRCHPLQQSRIDYFFVSDVLMQTQKLIRAVIDPGVKSDHSIIGIAIAISGNKRGPGLWRFNNSLLEDKNLTDQVSLEIHKASGLKGEYNEIDNPGLLLEVLLGKIRVYCIRRSTHLAKERRKHEVALEDRVAYFENRLSTSVISHTFMDQYKTAKSELDNYKARAAERAMLFCKANWLEQGEKPTKYFLNLEKKKSNNKIIHMLAINEHEYATGDREILKLCKDFYEDLHNSAKGPGVVASYMQDMAFPKLDENDRQRCEGPITSTECHEALKSMNANRSPSVSGFGKEFMSFFWEDIDEIVVKYINSAFRSGKMFITQRRGVLTLIPKAGDQKELKNKRPICLLDIIYKIIAKVLAMRLSSVINKIISTDQTGFLKGRCIQDNLRTIQDVIDYSKSDNTPGIVCALDFKAAFNSIEHSYIFIALRLFGFGESFTRWIALLYNDTELAVINNGYTSEWFKPKRGIMQGCPISGMLFNLAVELLAIQIRESEDIKGICVSNHRIKISQYADDATVFVRDEASIKAMVNVLTKYSEMSGLKLNVNKSKLMWIGSERRRTASVCGIPAVIRLKILGVYFSATEDCQMDNLEPILKSIKVTINMWQQRSLSIKGRITIAKSLLISKFIYIMPCVSIQTDQLRQIQSHIMKFLWRGRPPKVAAKSLCQSIRDGGLGAVDVCLLYESMRASWVKRMTMNVSWAQLLRARCAVYDLYDLLNSRYEQSDLIRLGLTNFYVEVLMAYRRINKMQPPINAYQIRRESLWLNEYIRCDGHSVIEESMYKCGIRYVKDVLDSRGAVLQYDKLKQKFPLLRVNFLRYMGIISAIPTLWKDKIKGTFSETININDRNSRPHIYVTVQDKRVSLHKIRTRGFYNLGLEICIPTALKRWEYEGLAPQKWSDILYLPYTCTRSTKLQSFQFQVIHRYVPTKKFLYLRRLVDTPNCPNCGMVDTLIHHFFLCHMVRSFWENVFAYINRHYEERLQPTLHNVLFGLLNVPHVFNLLIIIGKQYVHTCYLRERSVVFQVFLSQVSEMHKTERKVAANCSKRMEAFSHKWRMFKELE